MITSRGSKIVALCGKAGSGKTTAARWLNDRGYVTVKFATALKTMLSSIGLSHQELEGDLKEVPCALLMGKTPRQAMQSLGTEWGRQCIDQDIWVHLWKNHVCNLRQWGNKIVVDDVRFPNELEAVKSLGGISVMIRRKSAKPVNDHSSEDNQLDTDFSINNDQDLHYLYDSMTQILVDQPL